MKKTDCVSNEQQAMKIKTKTKVRILCCTNKFRLKINFPLSISDERIGFGNIFAFFVLKKTRFMNSLSKKYANCCWQHLNRFHINMKSWNLFSKKKEKH